MKKRLVMENVHQDFHKKWRKVIMYAAKNGFDIPDFMEELARVYHLEDYENLSERRFAEGEKEFADGIFSTLFHHADWDEKNALDEALIHAHIGILANKGELTEQKERELKLQCSDCATNSAN